MALLLLYSLAAAALLTTLALMRPTPTKRLRKANTVLISDVEDHKAGKVQGVVGCNAPLRSYTNRDCVYFRVEFTQDQAHQRSDAFIEERCDFRVEDKSGVAEVCSDGASFDVPMDFVEVERASRLSKQARPG